MSDNYRNKVPPALSFNLGLSETSSSDEEVENKNIGKLKLQNVPKSRYQAVAHLFPKQHPTTRHSIILSKIAILNKRPPVSSTPKLYFRNNETSVIDFSPITNKTKYNNDTTRFRSSDELPPSKRLKTSKSGIQTDENSNGDTKGIDLYGKKSIVTHESNNHKSRLSPKNPPLFKHPSNKLMVQKDTVKQSPNKRTTQPKKDNVTVRKTLLKEDNIDIHNIPETIDIVDRHELSSSRNLTFDLNPFQNNPKLKVKGSPQNCSMNNTNKRSLNRSCNLPCHSKYKKVQEAKAGFDKTLGLTAEVISISSECIENSEAYQSIQTEEKAKQVSKKNVSINTTRKTQEVPKEVPKVTKCSVSTQKNDIRDISTNTTPFSDSTEVKEIHIVQRERSRMSIGTNTTVKNVESKVKNRRTYQKKRERSVTPIDESTNIHSKNISSNNSPRKTIRDSLRPRNKNINYSSSTTTLSHTDDKPDNTAISQTTTNQTNNKQTKKRKKNKLYPSTLKPPKPKVKKENQEPSNQRLSGFYEMDLRRSQENKENNLDNRRSRRPPSLFIQSHVIGAGPLKTVLLKKLSTKSVVHNNQSEVGETKNETKRGSSVARKSVKDTSVKTRNKRQTKSRTTIDDDTTFKKPLPIKSLRTSSSTSNSSLSTIGYDKEPLIIIPQIETIDESVEENNDTADTVICKTRSQTRKNTDLLDLNKQHLATSVSSEVLSINKKQSASPKKTRENRKVSSQVSGNITNSLKPVLSSSTNSESLSQNKNTTFSSLYVNLIQAEADPSTSSPLNDAIYEIDILSSHSSLGNQNLHATQLDREANSNSRSSNSKPLEKPEVDQNKSVASSKQSNVVKETHFKPRKSVTFCEPIVENTKTIRQSGPRNVEHVLDGGSNENSTDPNTALAISERSIQQAGIMDTLDEFDGISNSDAFRKGAICSVIDNKPVLLRNYISALPDVTSVSDNALVNYTMKNIPHVGFALSSGCLVLGPRQKKGMHASMKNALFFVVLSGEGVVTVQGFKSNVTAGHHCTIPLGSIYSIKNSSIDKQLVLLFLKFCSK